MPRHPGRYPPVLWGLGVLLVPLLGYALRPPGRAASSLSADGLVSAYPTVRFTDVTRSSRIDFLHRHGGSGRHYYVETMSGGCAFLDYNGDGWLDLFLCQGAPLPGFRSTGPLRSALYRNNGDGTFTDATAGSGLERERYLLGAAVGDYDNDGRADLYLTSLGGNRLFHNEEARGWHGVEPAGRRGVASSTCAPYEKAAEVGPRTPQAGPSFRDVTRGSGTAGRDLSTSAAWLDYDRDGWLDLFVCRYMDYTVEDDPRCTDRAGRSAYCSPNVYQGSPCILYRNLGNGRFADISRRSGIARRPEMAGRSMGVVCADFNDDGWTDIYVANDLTPNFLFLNERNGTFRESAAIAGASHGENGVAYAGMGVDCGDTTNDGWMDLVCTNFENEPVSIFRNHGNGTFVNDSSRSGAGGPSLPYLKWGCRFVDLDLDGFQDLFVANGHVDDYADERGPASGGRGYAQPCQVLMNDRGGTFSDVSQQCGPFFARRQVARGAAFGDYDNDGDIDVLIACNNQPAVLLRNDRSSTPPAGKVIRLALVGSGASEPGQGCAADALGARVRVTAGSLAQTQYLRSGGSYLSDHDRRLVFGIGPAAQASVEVRWPCGARQTTTAVAGALLRIREAACRLAKRPFTLPRRVDCSRSDPRRCHAEGSRLSRESSRSTSGGGWTGPPVTESQSPAPQPCAAACV